MWGSQLFACVNTDTCLPLSNPATSEQSEKDAMSKHPYRHGVLRYLEQCLALTSFALNRLSRYQSNPDSTLARTRHLCRYIAGTQSYGVIYGKTSPNAESFSTTRPALSLASLTATMLLTRTRRPALVIFFSRKGPINGALASKFNCYVYDEAEFMAAPDAGCETSGSVDFSASSLTSPSRIKAFVPKYRSAEDIAESMTMKCRPCSTRTTWEPSSSEDPVLHGRMKHIDIRYHKIKVRGQQDCEAIRPHQPTDR